MTSTSSLQALDFPSDIPMDTPFPLLLEMANRTYAQHFPLTTCFERAVFFSWGCTIGDCTFCYMSTQPKDKPPRETNRSVESILAEFLLAKKLGWQIGFFSGGIGVFIPSEMEYLLKAIYEITGEKIWLNIGSVPRALLLRYQPYIRGIVASIETVNPLLHREVCPSKPMEPYEQMLRMARELGLERGMTFIVGLGEQKEDIRSLKEFIQKHQIDKIHIYGLIPTAGTPFEHTPPPSAEEQAWWIAQLRVAFPMLDIQCGIWEDRMDRVSLLLQAGANSVSKFQALKLFGTPIARQLEEQAHHAGRTFQGTVTKIPDVDWEEEVRGLSLESALKDRILIKLQQYLKGMQKNVQREYGQ